MKKILFIVAILSLVLAGCGQPEESMEIDASADQPPEITEKDEGTADVPGYESGVSKSKLSEDVQKLADKSEKIDSIEYGYQDGPFYTHVYLKDDKMKQDSFQTPDEYTAGEKYDTAYLDISEKTVEVYCEEKDDCDVEEPDVNVDYSEFVTETPFDVLEDIKGSAKITGTAIVYNKECKIVEYKDDLGRDFMVWIWGYNGIPLKYEIWKDDEKLKRIEFKGVVVNQVKDEDVLRY
ncbi:hypothetical protein GF336_03725 [Candidatus Woesearchaeota archaeon]|nr:hypothetical protein [Candidatus Woesearchaeota archaeon]